MLPETLLPWLNPRDNPTQSQAMDESSMESPIARTASLSLGDDARPDSPSSSSSQPQRPAHSCNKSPAGSLSSSPVDTNGDDTDTVAATDRLRTAFFRAAVFLQEAYYIWREHTYDHSLVPTVVGGDDDNSNDGSADPTAKKQKKTKKKMQIHLVHDKGMEVYDEPWELCEMSLFDFPHDKAASEVAREALLASCMCEDAAVVMARMIERVLGPFPATISEISVQTVDDPPLTMHLIEDNPSSSRHGKPDPAILNHYAHYVLLALPNGRTEEYAFDLTSAQYGWGPSYSSSSSSSTEISWSASNPPCPLVPWQTYATTRIRMLWFDVPAYSLRTLDDAYVVLGLRVGGGLHGSGGVTTAAATSSSPLPPPSSSPSSESSSSSLFPWPSLTNEEKRDIIWWSLNRHWDTMFADWEEDRGRLAEWACSPAAVDDGDAVWQAERRDALEWLACGASGLKKGVREAVEAYGGVVGAEEADEVRSRVREWAREWWPGLEEVMERGFEKGWRGLRDGFWAFRQEDERKRLEFD